MRTNWWKARKLSSTLWKYAQVTGNGSLIRGLMSFTTSIKWCGCNIIICLHSQRRHTSLLRKLKIWKRGVCNCMRICKTLLIGQTWEPILPSEHSLKSTCKYLNQCLFKQGKLQAYKVFNWVEETSNSCLTKVFFSLQWVKWILDLGLTHIWPT